MTVASPAERGDRKRYTMGAPAPGTYWRTRKRVKDRWDDRMQTPLLPKGTVLMLASIECADGAPHLYRFAPHPEWPKDSRDSPEFHADDFYTCWEPAPDGEQVRIRELTALLAEMENTKTLMLQPPPDAVPIGLLTHDPSAEIGEPGRALVTVSQVHALERRAAQLREDAEKRSSWIQIHSKALSRHGKVLANFHQERAEAALARAHAQLEGVAGILKTVANLRLYTGEGVEAIQLRAGEPAPVEERITIYQDVLSMDEEVAILLDLPGGLDHTETEALVEALSDPALLQRMIPASRGVVLANFRSTYKEFASTAGMTDTGAIQSTVRYNSQMSDESKRKRLLVRDGDRLWLVDADEVLSGIDQLMPSSGEQSGYFEKRGFWNEPPKQITRDDLDYAKAQRQQLGALDRYGQVLIVLWGLRDRESIFDDSNIPPFSNWLDEGFQHRYLQLVSKDTLIGVNRPAFSTWQAAQNAYLAAGTWVAIDLSQSFTQDYAPGAYSNGSYYSGRTHYDTLYSPDLGQTGKIAILRVQSEKDGLFVEIPCRYVGYKSVKLAKRNIKLRLMRGTTRTPGVLVLDRVRATDLAYYLESREQRRSYAQYVRLFQQAKLWVTARDLEEAGLRGDLRKAVIDALIPHDPDQLDDQMTDALAVVRAARRDRSLPAIRSPGYRAYREAALAALHAGLTDNTARVAAIEAWALAAGRNPLRLIADGKDHWGLYLVPTEQEHDVRLGAPAHATVAEVAFSSSGAATVRIAGRRLLRAAAREQIIHDWEGAQAWLRLEPGFALPYSSALETLELAITQSGALAAGEIDLEDLTHDAQRFVWNASKRYVERMRIGIAIGSALHGHRPALILATCDALVYAYHHGDAELKTRIRGVLTSVYAKNKEERARELDKPLEWKTLSLAIDDTPRAKDQMYFVHPENAGQLSADRCRRPDAKDKDSGKARVTGLTPAGAKLVPWLIQLTERGIG